MLRRTFLRNLLLLVVTVSLVMPTGMALAAEDPGAPADTTPAACTSTGVEVLTAGETGYAPGETVQVSGTGYGTECGVIIRVSRPDGSSTGGESATTDATGAFTWSYVLDALEGQYVVEVLGDADAVLASVTVAAAAPVDPAPVDPAPVDPAPVDPAPVDPAPVDPAPVDPAPIDPAPVDPAPVDPAPVEPAQAVPAPCAATGAETVTTDRLDYAPEETVLISGTGYAAGCELVVRVTRPDGSVVIGDGTFAPGSDTVVTGADGTVTYAYVLDGIAGDYLVEVLGEGGSMLVATVFNDSIPGSSPALFADPGLTIPKQAFERGDTVYSSFGPVTAPDIAARYTTSLVKPDGTVLAGSTSACLTPNGSGYIVDSRVLSETAFSTVGQRWGYRITVYPSAGCLGTPFSRTTSFHFFQAFAFDTLAGQSACISDATCGATTPAFAPGDSVFLKIAVSQVNRGPTGMIFRRPDASVACTIGFIGSDANGAMSFTYPAGSAGCPAIGPSDVGLWTMDVSAVLGGNAASPTFFPYATTNIPAFVVKAPLAISTALHDTGDTDVTGTAIALGSVVHDTASLTGTVAGFTPPTPTFTLFANDSCTGTGTAVATNGTEGSAARSVDVGPLAAGSYSFMAAVAENASYFGAQSGCEKLTVNTGTASVLTELHREIPGDDHVVLGTVAGVPYGATTHDKAIVTGVTGIAPTGTVTYQLFRTLYGSPALNCSGPTVGGPEIVAVGTESASKAALAPGRYTYLATYSGDTNYPGPVSAACEVLEIGKTSPEMASAVHVDGDHATDIQGTEVPLGSSAHDEAMITQVDGLAVTGTVTYEFFDGTTNQFASVCDGPRTTQTVAVGTESSATNPLPAGSYAFRVIYNGNESYQATTGPCEPFTIAKATPTISTVMHRSITGNAHVIVPSPSAIPLGSLVHDTSVLGGQVDSFAIDGTVTYTVYRTAFGEPAQNCAGPVYAGPLTFAVGVETAPFGPLETGRYTIKAVYDGNANYTAATAACEIFEVAKATPTVATQLHRSVTDNEHLIVPSPSAVPLGSLVHDSAIFGGTVPAIPATGDVTYTVFRTAFGEPAQNCAGPVFEGATAFAVGTETTPIGPLATGRYTVLAVYGGDSNYESATAACEIFEVAKATPTISTVMHRSITGNAHVIVPSPSAIPLGSLVHDTSVLGGQVDSFAIDGTVTYTVYRTAFGEPAQNCAGPVYAGPLTFAVGVETAPFGPLETGRYTIKAVYDGNANYTAATAACEIFEVAKATPRVETVVHREIDGGHVGVSNPGTVPLGESVHDKAFVVGGVDGFAFTGSVTFTLFKGSGTCTGTIVDGPDVAGLAGIPATAESPTYGPLTAGRYSYLAVYGGDDNYTEATARCEVFEVAKGATSTTTEIHEGSRDSLATHIVVPVGGYTFSPTVHDLATVTGAVAGVEMTGQVRYSFFNGSLNPYAAVCDGQPRLTELRTLGDESFDQINLPPGQYAFRATYLGDSNYLTSTSSCEPFTVVPNNAVTSSSLCTFDVDSSLPGSQFRLLFTPEMGTTSYKLNASNPGQFFYNVFYTGPGGEPITITIPEPFVTQGATPVHVYSGVVPVTADGVTCYTPGEALAGPVITGAPIEGTNGGTITVDLPPLASGFAYIAVHLDYGLKKIATGCTRDLPLSGDATCAADTILNKTSYTFAFHNTSSGSAIVSSLNEFKKNPGIGGLTLRTGSDDPVVGATVDIYLGTKKMASVKSDADGWYMWSYKYTGKPATFTVKLPAHGLSQTVTLKANGFLAVDFVTP